MKTIIKGNFIHIEKKKEWAEAKFNDDGIIYVSYGSLPYIKEDTGVTERLGHLINPKDYPNTREKLIEILKSITI